MTHPVFLTNQSTESTAAAPARRVLPSPIKAACVLQGTEQGSKWGRAPVHTESPIHWAAGGALQRAPVL